MRTILFAFLFFCSCELLAQSPANSNIFIGGNNDGYSKVLIPFTASNNSIFNGGANDGYSKALIPFAVSNNSIFNGGNNDGYSTMLIPFAVSNNGIFNGGNNDGYSKIDIAPLPDIVPAISIVASQTGQICSASQQLIFTASATNGGLYPIFQWKLNNVNVGSNSSTYENNDLQNNDVVSCVFTSSAGNAVPSTVISNLIVMNIITATRWYPDADADGFGNMLQGQYNCTQPAGYIADNTDCNDADASMHRSYYFYMDSDGDGFGAGTAQYLCAASDSSAPAGYSPRGDDCDDTNAAIVPDYRNYFRSKTNGSWQFASTWEQFDGCNWVNAITRPDFTDDIITIRSPHNVFVTTDIIVDQVIVEAGAALHNSSAGITLTVVDGPGDDIIVNGLFVLGYQGISNGAGNIVINGRMLWSTGTANPNLVINPGGILDKTHHNPLESTNENINLVNNSSITNYGTFNWIAGDVTMCGGYIVNMPGGVINAYENNTMSSYAIVGSPCGGAFLNNQGTFNKLEGTGNTGIYFGIANNGVINVNSGELSLMGGSSINRGAINITAGNFFTIQNGANIQLNEGTVITGAGTFKNAGYGQPSVTINTPVATPAVISNYLQSSNMFGSGTVLITGGMEWQGGAIAAHVVLAPGSVSSKTTTNVGYLQDSITNQGIFNWGNGDFNFNNGTFNNAGVFNINSDNGITNGNSNIFNNSGTLNKNAGTGSSLFYVPVNNSSVINVNEGELRLAGGTSVNTGNINIAAGKFFTIDNGANLQLNQGTVVAGAGTLKNAGYGQPSVTINTDASNPASISNYLMGSITYGSGTAVITGGMEWQGGTISANIILAATAVSNKTTNNGGTLVNCILTNNGTFNWIDGNLDANSAIYTNTATGIFNVSSGGYLYSRENSIDRFNNAGIFRRLNSSYPTDVYVPTNNSGTISGIGEIQFLNGLNNTGTIAPGIAGPGQLKISSAQPLSANTVLNIKLFDGSGPGTGHDQLLRTGNLTLAGTLSVTETGSVPPGDYTIIRITSGTINGSFATVSLPPAYTLQVNANTVVLTIRGYYADADADGYGDVNNYIVAATITPPPGYVSNGTDCNDNNVAINPGTIELCNGIDDNCDGIIDLAFITGVVCGTANENGTVTLTAPAGATFKTVNFASYGTPNGACGTFSLGGCHATNSKVIAESYLLNNNSASIPASNGLFGDPCPGTGKRLYIEAVYRIPLPINLIYYADTDADGFGNPSITITVADCSSPIPTGYVSNSTDCNDANANAKPSAAAGAISGITILCSGANSSFTSNGTPGGTWISRNTNVAGINAAGFVTALANGTTYIVYTVNNCTANGNSDSVLLTVASQYVWTGAGANANWNNAANWATCGIPPNGADVTINDIPNKPSLNVDVTVGALLLNGNASLLLNDKTLTINGAVTGAGTLSSSPASSLIIGGSAGIIKFAVGKDSIKNITLQQNASASIGNMIYVKAGTHPGVITLQQGATLNANGNLSLLSDINGTARVAQIPVNGVGAALATINGDVVFERHIAKNTYKAWHMLSIPTKGTQTIKQGWQENQQAGVAGITGFGTRITTAAGFLQNGFDAVTTKTSIQAFNPANGGLVNLISTLNPSETKNGYFIFIHGDRTVPISNSNAAVNATKLRTKGILYTGNQLILSSPANRNLMVGNIYPSAIDFTLLPKTGGIGNTYYIWDPKLNNGTTLGAYQTFSSTNGYAPTVAGGSYSGPNTRIESGQSFFVFANGTAGTIQMVEAAKIDGAGISAFRPMARQGEITVKLQSNINGTLYTADANTIAFDSRFTNTANGYDAPKLMNPGENIASSNNNELFAIEVRGNIAEQEFVQYHVSNLRQQAYQLQFDFKSVAEQGREVYLEDSYLKTSILLDCSNTITHSFTVTTDEASKSATRFKLVFDKKKLPVPGNNGAAESYITVSPNPVDGNYFNLNLFGFKESLCRFKLLDQKGAVIYVHTLNVTRGASSNRITLQNKPAAGLYTVELLDEKQKKFTARIVFR